jgi:hypothetical protein
MSQIRKALSLLVDVLREIFDESAYSRFLLAHALPWGRGSYRAFLQEQESVRARRPRCC